MIYYFFNFSEEEESLKLNATEGVEDKRHEPIDTNVALKGIDGPKESYLPIFPVNPESDADQLNGIVGDEVKALDENRSSPNDEKDSDIYGDIPKNSLQPSAQKEDFRKYPKPNKDSKPRQKFFGLIENKSQRTFVSDDPINPPPLPSLELGEEYVEVGSVEEQIVENQNADYASPIESNDLPVIRGVNDEFSENIVQASHEIIDFVPDPDLLDTTLFDVYLGDKLEARALVHFIDDYCQIEAPDDVLDQLAKIKKSEGLEALLTGWFKRKRVSEEIGTLECDTSTFRLVISLGPKYLQTKALQLLDKIPDPKNDFALQQRLRSAVAGELGDTLAASFQNRTIVSKGRNWAVLDGTYVQESGYEIDEASVSRTMGSIETTLGLLRTDGQFFASSVDYAGIIVRTSPNVFLNRDTLRGSPIEVFVPSRSRVEFFRGKRLLAVADLDYGLQEIDTSNFPQGSYDVEIVITEDTGRVIRENRLFTKSGLLEAGPIPIFSLAAGTIRDRRDLTSVPVGQLGLTWRLLDYLQLESSVYGTEELQLASTQFTTLYKGLILQGGYIHSNNDDAAYTASINGNLGVFNWNLNVREAIKGFQNQDTLTTATQIENDSTDPFIDPQEGLVDPEFNVLPNTLSNITGSVGVLLGDVRLRYSYNSNESINRGLTQRRYSYGPRFDWTFFRRVNTQLNFQTSMLDTEEGRKFLGFLSFNYRFGRFSTEGNLQHRNEELIRESRLLTGVNYDSKTFSGRGTRARLTDELVTREDKNSSNGTTNEIRNRLEVDHTNNLSQLRGFVRDLRSSDNQNTSVGLDLNTNFTIDKDASVMVSSPPLQDSMVLIHVKGSSSVGLVEIVINGQVRDTIKVGDTAAIGLQPFDIYRLNIRPAESAGLLEYDSEVREFTLFPGNVVKEEWSVDPITIGIGRIVDRNGEAIPWTRIKGLKHYTATEADGSFQAELSTRNKLYIEKGGVRCDIVLPKPEGDNYVQDFGDLICHLGDQPL